MNSRSPRRKFVFFCCVTLLELINKKTFGVNKDSPQGQESKRFSLFYKVKEGMFKKLLHDPSNFVLQFVSQFTCAGQNIVFLCISRKGKGIPRILTTLSRNIQREIVYCHPTTTMCSNIYLLQHTIC